MIIIEFIIEFLWATICYHLGLGFLLVVTFGRYPPTSAEEQTKTFVEIIGLSVFVGLVLLCGLLPSRM